MIVFTAFCQHLIKHVMMMMMTSDHTLYLEARTHTSAETETVRVVCTLSRLASPRNNLLSSNGWGNDLTQHITHCSADINNSLQIQQWLISRLDYCNSVLVGLPASTVNILQRVQNAADRLICQLKPRKHVTTSLQQLHWLPVKQRVQC